MQGYCLTELDALSTDLFFLLVSYMVSLKLMTSILQEECHLNKIIGITILENFLFSLMQRHNMTDHKLVITREPIKCN